ncbi:hypothetical protein RhiirB3_394545 [Rhizophagus irregularis]|nr:hypothetical protein RhiirB3_394545 [Rhizophagus irregularis]
MNSMNPNYLMDCFLTGHFLGRPSDHVTLSEKCPVETLSGWIIIQIHSTVKASSNKDLVSCDNVDIQYGHLVNLPWSNSSIGPSSSAFWLFNFRLFGSKIPALRHFGSSVLKRLINEFLYYHELINESYTITMRTNRTVNKNEFNYFDKKNTYIQKRSAVNINNKLASTLSPVPMPRYTRKV